MADTTGADAGERCTCPMSVRETRQHSVACAVRGAAKLKTDARIFAERWNAGQRGAREVARG
jgi:hypothetical protein